MAICSFVVTEISIAVYQAKQGNLSLRVFAGSCLAAVESLT